MVIRPIVMRGGRVRVGFGVLPPDVRATLVFLAGIVIFVWVVLMWILPSKKAALAFSPAELHFLFPAPITRRQLIQYKLLQAQVGILFGAFVSAFISGARLTHADGWARVLTFWLFFGIGHLHGIASSFVRTDLMEAGWSAVRRRLVSITVALVIVGAVVIGCRDVWAEIARAASGWLDKDFESTIENLGPLALALSRVGETGLSSVVLWPFLALPRLLLAHTPGEFLLYGGIGLIILLLHYVWVIRADTSFEEASLELSQKVAARRAARRQTRTRGGVLVKRAGGFPWKLKPTGRPETALVWKNLVNLTRVTPVRALLALTAFLLFMSTWVIQIAKDRDDLWALAAIISALIAAFTAALGPVFLRNDLREDLYRIDALKTMPLAGHSLVWAEILGAWTALTIVEVAMLVLGGIALAMSGTPSIKGVGVAWLYAGAGAGLLFLPGLTLVAVGLQNALVVMFPAWVQLGAGHARGFEASGQRILTLFGTMFALFLVAVPAAISGGVAAWLLAPHVGPACLPVGAAIAFAWMVGEVAFGCRLLGKVLDRLDPSTAGIEGEDAT
jgi:hypothetical protein